MPQYVYPPPKNDMREGETRYVQPWLIWYENGSFWTSEHTIWMNDERRGGTSQMSLHKKDGKIYFSLKSYLKEQLETFLDYYKDKNAPIEKMIDSIRFNLGYCVYVQSPVVIYPDIDLDSIEITDNPVLNGIISILKSMDVKLLESEILYHVRNIT